MIRRFVPVLLILSLGVPARADDLSDRVDAAIAKCASEDPAERVEGARLLGEIADVDPQRLKKAVEHPDPEVAGIAATVLVNRGIFLDTAKADRCREILEEIAKEGLEAAKKRLLLEELLNLGPAAVAIVEAELGTAETANVAAPVVVLDADADQVVPLRLKNTGRRGLWYSRGSLDTYPYVGPFGQRPLSGGMGGRRSTFRSFDGTAKGPPPVPEDMVLRFLSFLQRVPPGETFEAGTCKLSRDRCGIVSISSSHIGGNPRLYEGTFSGRSLVNRTATVSVHPSATVVLLAERRGPSFRLAAVREGDGWALEVTALADGPVPHEIGIDPFWWAAEGDGRAFLGNGPLRIEKVEDAAWTKGEVRRIPLTTALPAGTTRLWFGYDHDPADDKPEQYVAAPVEVR